MERFIFIPAVILFTLLSGITLKGQSVIRGRVTDSDTGESLAFVNIVYNEKGTGTTTNLDGYFTINAGTPPGFLKLSYVGYEPVYISPVPAREDEPLQLTMKRKSYLLEEITVYPGINPAHRIIENAFRNRRINNPEMLSSFSYTSYNKLYFTLLPDSLLTRISLPGSAGATTGFNVSIDAGAGEQHGEDPMLPEKQESVDSSEIRMREFLEKQHLFLMESVSEREYLRPGRNNEKVTASRVSGFRDPSFTLLATQLQSFSFYDDFISLLDKNYLNPISRGSTSRYSFILEDSILTEQNDTLYIISFRPYPGRNFDGLQGVVYINSNRYAVQNVIAGPFEPRGIFNIRIQQNYLFVDDMQWFPAELNTDIILGTGDASSGSGSRYNLVGVGKSYLSDILIEPELRRRQFNNIELTIASDAHRQTDEFWNQYRVEPLSKRDRHTYHVIDSIGEEVNLDRSLQIFEALATGYIPWGFVNVDYNSLLDYNFFEGLRPGFRTLTNQRVSDRFALGGHVGWGTRDRVFKYGGEAAFNLSIPADVTLGFSWSNDVEETGSWTFLEDHSLSSTESYRRFLIGRMDYIEKYGASLSFRFMRYFRSNVYFSSSFIRPGNNYVFLRDGVEQYSFRFPEAGVQLRFAWREKFMQTPGGNRISMGTDYPVLWFNYGRGLRFDGGYEYTRVQARLHQNFVTRGLGRTSVTVEGGMVTGDVPLNKLYSGKASFRSFSLEAANSFGTMRMDEFVSSEFVSLFFRHNFESLLFRSGSFRPSVIFVTNIGYGKLTNATDHLYIQPKSPEKGYYESGLLFNDLYRRLFAGYGLGILYRYGPYAFDNEIDNFAFKLTFSMSLR